jgi:PAS domain S-box-containing protein
MIGRWAQRTATAIERPAVAVGLTLAAVAAAAAVGVVLQQVVPDFPVVLVFFPALLFATQLSGGRGGAIALFLSLIVGVLVFWPDAARLDGWSHSHSELVLFAGYGALTVFMSKALRVGIRHGVAAEERFRAAQEAALDAFVIVEPILANGRAVDFRWVYANPAADVAAPVSAGGRLTGKRVTEVFPPEGANSMIGRMRSVLETGGPDEIEVKRVIDGDVRWMRSSGVRLRDGVAITFRDVTEERRATRSLRDAEAELRVLMNALPQLIWSSRADGACDYFSPQWLSYAGGESADYEGARWLAAVHPDDRDLVERAWTQALAGQGPFELEFRLLRHDGAWRWFSGKASPVLRGSGAVRRWYAAATDITDSVESRQLLEERVAERTRALEESQEERARTEASLAQAQRLETVGRLTGGVAHDFNNLLTVVIGALDMMLKTPQDVARVRRLGEAALAAGHRGERLTRQLLAFSRRQELKLEVADAVAVITQVEPLIRRAVGEAVDIRMDCDPAAGAARLDPAQFEAALLNLVVNAADATPPGGWIRISAERAHLDEGDVQGAAAGDYVKISVGDSGAGMAPDVLARVFEPFFTTKEVGKGTGLGLAQVYGFVTQSGGSVAIESVLAGGTTVSLYLPAVDETPETPAAIQSPQPADLARGARVLLVEDDDAVRTVSEDLLAELGCVVFSESDGAGALRRLEGAEPFDLVISDIVMPGGVSGIELARAAGTLRPGLKVILTTGYAGAQGVPASDLEWPVLRKPFRAEQLAEVLSAALAERMAERAA